MGPTLAKYPKTYAEIVGVFPIPRSLGAWPYPEWLVVETEDGRQLTLRVGQKDGGSRGRMKIGARVKMFRRPQDTEVRFRMVGR